jgi:hypothetical protein
LEHGDTTPVVQGVCHQITQKEWEGIVATEGGGGVYHHGYHSVTVNPIPLMGDQTPIRAVSLSVGKNSPALKLDGYLHPPSRRYVNLLSEGAKYYQLEPTYVEWLESHKCYDRKEHISHSILYYIAMSGILLFALPILSLFVLNTLLLRVLPRNIYRKFSYVTHATIYRLGRIVWAYHDTLHWLFGRFGWITVERAGSKNIHCPPKVNGVNGVNNPASNGNAAKL